MRVGVAVGQADEGESFEVMTRRIFIGEAHAAVQLHRLLADKARLLADQRLGRRRQPRALGWLGVGGPGRSERGDGIGLLFRDVHVGQTVLDGLKAADRHAELFARLDVIERVGIQRANDADGLAAQRNIGQIVA